MFSRDDDNQGLVLGVVFGLIAMVIALVIGLSIYQAKRAVIPPAAAPAALSVEDGASVQVVDGVVKFYFASGKADLAAGANQAMADVVKAAAAGKRLVVSGFHDASGDPAMNAELAKQRALTVREALKALGVAEDKVELKKPEQTMAEGPANEARRVEVVAQ